MIQLNCVEMNANILCTSNIKHIILYEWDSDTSLVTSEIIIHSDISLLRQSAFTLDLPDLCLTDKLYLLRCSAQRVSFAHLGLLFAIIRCNGSWSVYSTIGLPNTM